MAGKKEAPTWVAPAVAGLVLYKNKAGKVSLELFDVEHGELCRPRVPDRHTMADIAKACNMANEDDGPLGGDVRNCLTVSEQNMVFVKPPCEQNVIVGYSGEKTRTVRIWCPTTVFAYSFSGGEHVLNAFWTPLKSADLLLRLVSKEKFYACELPNIDNKGSVCLGNSMSRVEYNSDIGTMQESITRSFYGSTFNEWRSPRVGKVFSVLKKCLDVPEIKRHERFWKSDIMKEAKPIQLEIDDDGIDF